MKRSPFVAPQMFAFYIGAVLWIFLLAPRAHAAASHDPCWDVRLCEPIGDGIRWLGGKIQDWMGW